MRKSSKAIATMIGAAAIMSCSQGIAAAQPKSQVLYAHRAWEVRGVVFDSGAPMCVALVQLDGAALSIWADGSRPISLQFYARDWDFGQTVSDIEVQVDSRDEWTLGGAELFDNAVFFSLPSDDVSVAFLGQVADGMTLHLRNGNGDDLYAYTLSGSNASIRALGRCVDALRARADAGDPDPFD